MMRRGGHVAQRFQRDFIPRTSLFLIQDVVVRHPEQPTLRRLDLLAGGAAEEETEERLLQRIMGRLPVARQRPGVTQYAAGLPLVKVDDFLLNSRRERADGATIHRSRYYSRAMRSKNRWPLSSIR